MTYLIIFGMYNNYVFWVLKYFQRKKIEKQISCLKYDTEPFIL